MREIRVRGKIDESNIIGKIDGEKPVSNIRGRFSKPADKLAAQYTASLSIDRRLYRQDIAGSIAHAKMLAKQGIISDEDAAGIVKGWSLSARR